MKKTIAFVLTSAMIGVNAVTAFAAPQRITEGDYVVEVNEDGNSVTIAKYRGQDFAIEIPAVVKDMPVTGLGFWMTWGDDVYEVTIPDSVVEINKNFLESGTALEEFIVGENNERFEAIDGVLFDKQEKSLYLYPKGILDNPYEIPEGIKAIDENAFCDCSNLVELIIPGNVEIIEKSGVADCNALKTVEFSEGLKFIGEKAFANCLKLENFVIPASVNQIEYTAFVNLKSVSEFAVSEENETYGTIDGVLINKVDNTLINYPIAAEASEYVIPESIKVIADSAFKFCSNLKTVVIPVGVTSIGPEAFYWCENMEQLSIPSSVNEIGLDAFVGCNGIELSVKSGSFAEQYAKDNGINYKIMEE